MKQGHDLGSWIKGLRATLRLDLVCLVGFLLSWLIFWQLDPALNRAGATVLYNLVSGSTPITVVGWIATLGDSIWFPAVFYLYVLRRDSYDWTSATVLAVAIVTATALVTILKIVFGLPRPFQDPTLGLTPRFETPTDHGLPSGHTTAAFTVATVVWTRYPKWRVPFTALAAATGVCMIILGLHFPSDVLAGTFLGIFSGTFALSLAKLRTQA